MSILTVYTVRNIRLCEKIEWAFMEHAPSSPACSINAHSALFEKIEWALWNMVVMSNLCISQILSAYTVYNGYSDNGYSDKTLKVRWQIL